ncbi:MAG: hypothetical protein KAI79_15255 [Bacteroidales bacterium]|nr:hypothetical protein [Bacteroidales bacterium]
MMQQILQTINKASQTFMFGHVTLNEEKIAAFKLENVEGNSSFFNPPPYLQQLLKASEKEVAYKIIHIFNAINASLQYCFFTANTSTRFDGIDSQWIIKMIDGVFEEVRVTSVTDVYRTKDLVLERLIGSNITLLKSRVETIEEVFAKLNFYEYSEYYMDVAQSIQMLSKLVCFKEDIFFKKGLFAVMMTGRMLPELKAAYTNYAKELSILPVPADYQIPKMLRHYGLIEFSDVLGEMVDSSVLLQENSEMELNIRAATAQACRLISEVNGVSVDEVDAYLFMKRKESGLRHHLCVTVSY